MACCGKRNSHDFSVSRMERPLDTFLRCPSAEESVKARFDLLSR